MSLRVVVCAVALLYPALGTTAPELPFDTTNQGLLIQLHGLPAIGTARPLAPAELRAGLSYEAANHFLAKSRATESLHLDGETHRTTLKLVRGFSAGREIGIEIPYVDHGGGFLDSFIENWHDFFGLPQNGRDRMPHDQLLFNYRRDGVDRIRLTQPTAGVGDVRLTAGQLLGNGTDTMLRFSLKLPTGDDAELLGSGTTDIALWFSTRCRSEACPGAWSWYGGGGLLWMDRGKVLPDLQRRLVGFGSAGLHWRALERVTLGVQLDTHTPFYDDSELKPLSGASVQLVMGGWWRMHPRHALEIAVIEDVAVDTAPDVVIRIGLHSWF